MTPGDAVRKKAQDVAERMTPHSHVIPGTVVSSHDGVCVNCVAHGYERGHAEGRAEGLREAAGLVCNGCRDNTCRDNFADWTCMAIPIHRELARLRGGK